MFNNKLSQEDTRYRYQQMRSIAQELKNLLPKEVRLIEGYAVWQGQRGAPDKGLEDYLNNRTKEDLSNDVVARTYFLMKALETLVKTNNLLNDSADFTEAKTAIEAQFLTLRDILNRTPLSDDDSYIRKVTNKTELSNVNNLITFMEKIQTAPPGENIEYAVVHFGRFSN